MILIKRPETDPYFNIAAEEYFLKNRCEDIVMVWQSKPVVVVGKHQNTFAEVNLKWTRKNNVPVIRRISGGGTVYHDEGNLNLTVIRSEARKDHLIDFSAFTQPVISFLRQYRIEAKFEGKNNLVADNKKFSGNSAHVYKNRVIHHGTLLFNTNIDNLNDSIKPNFIKVEDKAVKSIRSTVGNISEYLDESIPINNFKNKFKKYLVAYFNIETEQNILQEEIEAIRNLVNEKYDTWEWNFGYSPSYKLHTFMTYHNVNYELQLQVEKGKIKSIEIPVNNPTVSKIYSVINKLIGLPQNPDILNPYLRKLKSVGIIINL